MGNVNLLIYEISDFSNVFVNNGFCVMQQLLLSLNPILSGEALESIHLMNNGNFNPETACIAPGRGSHMKKKKIKTHYFNKSDEYSVSPFTKAKYY